MAVIAVYSMKGGVGKTTMSVDLAWRFAQVGGHETLLYDLDPQGGAGFLLGHEERKVQKAISAFHHARAPRDLIEPTKFDRLSLIGADQSLRDLPVQLARIGAKKRLAQMLSFMKGEYPRIVLDCPPMINEVSEQIMEAADLIVVPLPASPSSVKSRPLEETKTCAASELAATSVTKMSSPSPSTTTSSRKPSVM